jgi:ribonuclease R
MATTRAPAEPRVGVLTKRGRFLVAEPFFERGRRLNVVLRRRGDARAGDLVLLRPSRRGGRGTYEVVRRLGRPNVARDVIEALLLERGYERGVPQRVELEAREAVSAADPAVSRRDLTAMPTFTIDPASARDFDDAVSAEPRGDGLRLLVHIADVGSFVAPGSALDGEAAERGNSVYVPGTVEPMLPEALSSNVCSLVPGHERRTFTVDMELRADGEVGRVSFYRSLIRSDARMTYEQVDRIFAGAEQPPPEVAEPLALARRAAEALRNRRLARGALGVDTSEPEFDFDERGNVVGARDVEQEESHRVIEQLMVLANEQVALRLDTAGIPTVYRVHEQPDPDRVEQLVAQLASLDVPTPPVPEHMTPRTAGELAGRISLMLLEYLESGRAGRLALTSLVLRSLKQAVYSPRNIGHAGLASPAYCHFTSPIRRYRRGRLAPVP